MMKQKQTNGQNKQKQSIFITIVLEWYDHVVQHSHTKESFWANLATMHLSVCLNFVACMASVLVGKYPIIQLPFCANSHFQ
jgi:hypothetical protein